MVIPLLLIGNVCMAQTTRVYGFQWFKSDNYNWGKNYFVVSRVILMSPADMSGLRKNDIIKTINGEDVSSSNNLSELFNFTNDVLEVNRIGSNELIKISMQLPLEYPKNAVDESDIIKYIFPSTNVLPPEEKNWQEGTCKYNIFNDFEDDFFKYKTYDYVYINKQDPLLEKKNIQIIDKILSEKTNLTRDKQNPDFLISIDYFSGDKEQYVVPTQKISTTYTYRNQYNYGYTKEQHINSKEEGNYYISKRTSLFKVTFLNANKYKTQINDAAFWQGECEDIITNELAKKVKSDLPVYNADSFIKNAFTEMLEYSYPYVSKRLRWYYDNDAWNDNKIGLVYGRGIYNNYFYTGICYDKETPNMVVFVYPGSPAHIGGIKRGDVVQTIIDNQNNKLKIPNIWNDVKMKATVNRDFSSAVEYKSLKNGFEYLYKESNEKIESKNLIFKVKRNGKTFEIPIVAEKTPFLL